MIDSPFTQRAKADRRRKYRRYAYVAAGVLGLALVLWFIAFSSVMKISSVNIEGNNLISSDDLRAAAKVDTSMTLARTDTAEIALNVAAVPQIESVQVRRSWPRTLTISVNERDALGWFYRDGRFRIFDENGVVFNRTRKEPKKLIEIRHSGGADTIAKATASTAAVISILADQNPALVDKVSYVQVKGPDSITLHITDGTQVRWGNAERSEEKLAVLRVLRKISARVYDVSAPNQPTTAR